MNKPLIQKVIRTDDGTSCPVFNYENPLLDRTVAKALSSSLVKILRVSQANSNINNNLRYSVLANIRKTCRIQPQDHIEVDETTMNLLTEVYTEEVRFPHIKAVDTVEKNLDDFLVRKMKDNDVSSNYHSSLNPEVAQSLVNLNDNSINAISLRVLDLDTSANSMAFVKCLWSKPLEDLNNVCDISIRMKPEIEKNLLETCHKLLSEPNLNIEELLTANFKDLIEKCSISPECFQICCGILNYVFFNVNFNQNIQLFIAEFVNRVKKMCFKTISVLYPIQLSHVVVLLDCDIRTLPMSVQKCYIHNTLTYLKNIQSEADLVMLLTHNPDWFDIYFSQ